MELSLVEENGNEKKDESEKDEKEEKEMFESLLEIKDCHLRALQAWQAKHPPKFKKWKWEYYKRMKNEHSERLYYHRMKLERPDYIKEQYKKYNLKRKLALAAARGVLQQPFENMSQEELQLLSPTEKHKEYYKRYYVRTRLAQLTFDAKASSA